MTEKGISIQHIIDTTLGLNLNANPLFRSILLKILITITFIIISERVSDISI